jgi:hypothetical protein
MRLSAVRGIAPPFTVSTLGVGRSLSGLSALAETHASDTTNVTHDNNPTDVRFMEAILFDK